MLTTLIAPRSPLRFTFTTDGRRADDGEGDMSVTYIGRIDRKAAACDARRRFEAWSNLHNPLVRRWQADQIVLA